MEFSPSRSRERGGQGGSRAGWELEELSEREGILPVTQARLTRPRILPDALANLAFLLLLTRLVSLFGIGYL